MDIMKSKYSVHIYSKHFSVHMLKTLYGYNISCLMSFYKQKTTVLCQNSNLIMQNIAKYSPKTFLHAKHFAKYSKPINSIHNRTHIIRTPAIRKII